MIKLADINSYMLMLVPWLKTIVFSMFGLGIVAGLGYFLFVIKRRRKWVCNLFELKADHRLHFVGKDTIIERKINKGKQLVYMMHRNRTEVMPPPWECVYRYRGKEYTDYIRVMEDDFRPAKRVIDEKLLEKINLKYFIDNIKDALFEIKHIGKKDVYDKYIYAPINNKLAFKLSFNAVDYDINQMRINAIDNRDKIYADKKDFLEKYGTYIAIGIIVVLIIVVLYLSYDYSANVISQAMGQAAKTTSLVENLAERMGGISPAS